MASERTYIMVKPDGVQRGLVGEVIKRFEQKGFKLVALKLYQVRPRARRAAACSGAGCGRSRSRYSLSLARACARSFRSRSPLACFAPRRFPYAAQASKAHMEAHYADLATKKFFPSLIEYMTSGPVACMVWEGKEAVKMGRMLLGATKPSDSLPGTIRGDFAVDVGRNICHGSDAVESANAEIKHWFPEGVVEWASHSAPQLYE
jgi:nucleoside-diphosphate kinase